MLKQKTVYFREEDLELWEAIENKAEWLHLALHGIRASTKDEVSTALKSGKIGHIDGGVQIIKTKQDAEKAVIVPLNKVSPEMLKTEIKRLGGLCKVHGISLDSRGRCLQKGCKYA